MSAIAAAPYRPVQCMPADVMAISTAGDYVIKFKYMLLDKYVTQTIAATTRRIAITVSV